MNKYNCLISVKITNKKYRLAVAITIKERKKPKLAKIIYCERWRSGNIQKKLLRNSTAVASCD